MIVKRSNDTVPFIAYQISSGMRNAAYQPLYPEPGRVVNNRRIIAGDKIAV